jgi:hypothetical protein
VTSRAQEPSLLRRDRPEHTRVHQVDLKQALLSLAWFLPQLAHLDFERFYRFEHFERSQEFTPTEALPQALGP